mgnify:CR=1 FL=1
MMQRFLITLIILITALPGFSQRVKILNELKDSLLSTDQDTTKIKLYADISHIYGFLNEDSCFYYTNRGLELAQQINYEKGEVLMLNHMGLYYLNAGNLPEALQVFIKARKMATKNHDQMGMALNLLGTALLYSNIDPVIAKRDILHARRLTRSEDNRVIKLIDRIDINLGIGYMNFNQLDSAYVYLNGLYRRMQPGDFMYTPALLFFGNLQAKMGNTTQAIKLLNQSVEIGRKDKDYYTLSDSYYYLANIYNGLNMPDSAIWFAEKSYENAKLVDRKGQMLTSADLCASLYEPVNLSKSYEYLKIVREINDEIYGGTKIRELQKLVLEEQEHQLMVEQEQIQYKNRVRLFVAIGVLIVLAFIAFILYQNNLRGKKLNNKLQSALDHLKETQAQLIHSEKMASLGELTAGIAHEIQNPLNFVNNFSEVNNELLDDLKEAIASNDQEEIEVLFKDLKENESKVMNHGKRAESIVKGMLLHSRGSNGQKEPTDINALCDEYLRLSYHGFRAKDKSFNAEYKFESDKSLPKINVVPQDIGRVLLNLINNAFHAVSEKSKLQASGFKPQVVVSTSSSPLHEGGNRGVKITVSDNGPGIPASIKDKIFQPFFTTKPTGQGTGLGLSLSYDIVKAHGGELKVETREGDGTTFSITLNTK